jgi:hypothetical protein
MRVVRRNWYTLGLAVAVISVVRAFVGSKTTVQVILLLNHTVLLLDVDGGSPCSDTRRKSSSLSL